jgi:WD40 repeat protein
MAESLSGGRVGLVDLRRGRLLDTLPARNGPLADALAFSPDGRTLATGGNNGNVTLWDVRRRFARRTLRHDDRVRWVAISPDGALLAVQTRSEGSSRSLVAVRDLRTGRVLYRHAVANGDGGLAFRPGGHALAALGCCSPGSTVAVWEPRSGAMLFRPRVGGHATSIAYSPGGRLLGVGTEDGRVLFLDSDDGSPLGPPLQVATGAVDPISFSPDDRLLAASSADQTTTVWDVGTRKRLGSTFAVEPASIPVARFAPDGDLVIDNLADTAVWPMRLTAWRRFACRAAGRDLTRGEWSDLLPNRPYRHTC